MLTSPTPIDMAVDKSAELFITTGLGIIAVLGLLYGLHQWRKTGRPVMFMLLVAGGLMMIHEPLVDTVAKCWFPANSWVAFEAWGRPMPVWLCLAYFFYFGIASAMIWLSLHKGMTSRQLHFAFIAAMIGDLLFESALLTVDPYTYYGYQPLWLPNGFPLWWMTVNGLIPIVLGAIVFRFDDFFRGWNVLAIIPLGLITSAAVNASVGWPAWLVINTELPWLVTQLGGIATFVIAFALLGLLAKVVASDSPYRPAQLSTRFVAG